MGHQLQSFLPSMNQIGKFFKIEIDNQAIEYKIRCYYDLDEIIINPGDKLTIFRWDDTQERWTDMNPIRANSSLRYVEVKISGNVLLSLDEKIKTSRSPGFSVIVIMLTILLGSRRNKKCQK